LERGKETMSSNFVAKGVDGYEASMGRWSRRLAQPFLDFSGVPSQGRVLDAGCGTGSLTEALTAHATLNAIEALDFDEEFITALQRRTTDPRVRAQKGDVCALPYVDGVFDGAYSLLVLHFVSDPDRAVQEMRRVLRPGGSAAAAVWSHGGLPSWRLFWDTVVAVEPQAANRAPGRAQRPMTGEGELGGAFGRAGFTNIAETMLSISMDYAGFEDFWYPTMYGQGTFGALFDGLPHLRRDRLREAMKEAYLGGQNDGPRSFTSLAWAVRGSA
jgi:SAM-dependent methyltransferase